MDYWVTADYGSNAKKLTLSRKGLGEFIYHLFKLGGMLHSGSALNAQYDSSYVQIMVSLPPGKKEELERLTGIGLEKPSTLTPA